MKPTHWRVFLRRQNTPAARMVSRYRGACPAQSRTLILDAHRRGKITEAEMLRLIERVERPRGRTRPREGIRRHVRCADTQRVDVPWRRRVQAHVADWSVVMNTPGRSMARSLTKCPQATVDKNTGRGRLVRHG